MIKKIPNLIRPFIMSWHVQYLLFEALFHYLRMIKWICIKICLKVEPWVKQNFLNVQTMIVSKYVHFGIPYPKPINAPSIESMLWFSCDVARKKNLTIYTNFVVWHYKTKKFISIFYLVRVPTISIGNNHKQ
jgi:hypothetical protein